ncbi:MAG: hypothetical protein NTZ68_00440 [Candidatus Dependentiae bacterium]|nr:hypothetical protein [Candidatus Dependentiae bacterium]
MKKNIKLSLLLVALCAGFGLKAMEGEVYEAPRDQQRNQNEQITNEQLQRERQERSDRQKQEKDIELRLKDNKAFKETFNPKTSETKIQIARPGTFKRIFEWFTDMWGDTATVHDQLSAHNKKRNANEPALDQQGRDAFGRLRPDQQEDALNKWLTVEISNFQKEQDMHNDKVKKDRSTFAQEKAKMEKEISANKTQINNANEKLTALRARTSELSPSEKTKLETLQESIKTWYKNNNILDQSIRENEYKTRLSHLDNKTKLQELFNPRIETIVNQAQGLMNDGTIINYNTEDPMFEFHNKTNEKVLGRTNYFKRPNKFFAGVHRARENLFEGAPTGTSEEQAANQATGNLLRQFESGEPARASTQNQPDGPSPLDNLSSGTSEQRQQAPIDSDAFQLLAPAPDRTQDRSLSGIQNFKSFLNNQNFFESSEQEQINVINEAVKNYKNLSQNEQQFTLFILEDNKMVSNLTPENRRAFIENRLELKQLDTSPPISRAN